MVFFDRFELAPGVRLHARIERGHTYGVQLEPSQVNEDIIARYLSTIWQGKQQGELWLEEIRSPSGDPVPLRKVPRDQLLGFFAGFVGVVLRDGGLIDDLTIRDNLLLPFRYHRQWPSKAEMTEAAVARQVAQLVGGDSAGVGDAALLDYHPSRLAFFARRYWGALKTLLRKPQLLVILAPFDGVPRSDQQALLRLLCRYQALEPQSASLLVLTGPHEVFALGDTEWTDLTASLSHLSNEPLCS